MKILIFVFFLVSSIFRNEHVAMCHSPQIASSGNINKLLIKNLTFRIYTFLSVPGSTRRRKALYFLRFVLSDVSKMFDQKVLKFQNCTKNGHNDNNQSQNWYWYEVFLTVLSYARNERWFSCFLITKFSKERIGYTLSRNILYATVNSCEKAKTG